MRTINLYDKEITVTYSDRIPEGQELTLLCQLYDAETTVVREELNGSYELEMIYVATGQNADQIAPDLILGAWVPLRDSVGENYFRIFRVEKDLGGRIYVYARNLASDLTYTPVRNNTQGSAGRFTQVVTWALMLREYAMDNIPFNITDEDDISLAVSYAMPFKTVASALAYIGGSDLIEPDKSMLEIFGGEVVFDKFAIKRYNERGTDRNTTVAYGVNMDNIILTDDLDEVYTAYVLYYADDQFQVASDVYKTAYADEFGFTRTALIDWTYYLTEAGYTTQAQILAALNSAAATYRDNHQDEPVRQIEVDVVSAEISDVYLGDHVPVTYYRHGENINTRMKVVAYEWDVLMQRYNTLTLGAVQQTLAKEIAASNAAGGLAQSESGALASLVQRVTATEAVTNALHGVTAYASAEKTLTTSPIVSSSLVELVNTSTDIFSVSGSYIEVLESGVYEVSGIVWFGTGFNENDLAHAEICTFIGSTATIIAEGEVRIKTEAAWTSVPVPPMLIEATGGTKFGLYAHNQTGARGKAFSAAGRARNYITVKRVR